MSLIRKLAIGINVRHNKAGIKSANRGIHNIGLTAIATGLALHQASKALFGIVKAGAALERQEAAFSTIFKSATLGAEMLAKVNKLAAETTFTPEETRKNAIMMRAMGIETKAIIPTMMQFGDILAALPNLTLERLALNFGQVRSAGALTGRELRDFVSGGVPLLEELQKMYGKSATAVRDMIKRKEVSFTMVQKAFDNMTSAGGRFHGMMMKYAKTAEGVSKIIRSKLFLMMEEVGIKLVRKIKPFLMTLDKWLKDNKDVLVKRLTTALGNLFNILIRLIDPAVKLMVFFSDSVDRVINAFSPYVEGLLDIVEGLDKYFSSLNKTNPAFRQFTDTLALAARLLVGATVAAGIGLLGKALFGLLKPLGLLAAKLVLVAIPFLILEDIFMHLKYGNEADTFFGKIIDSMGENGKRLEGAVEEAFGPIIFIGKIISSFFKSLETGESFIDILMGDKTAKAFMDKWSARFQALKDYIMKDFNEMATFLKETVYDNLVKAFGGFTQWLKDSVRSIGSILSTILGEELSSVLPDFMLSQTKGALFGQSAGVNIAAAQAYLAFQQKIKAKKSTKATAGPVDSSTNSTVTNTTYIERVELTSEQSDKWQDAIDDTVYQSTYSPLTSN